MTIRQRRVLGAPRRFHNAGRFREYSEALKAHTVIMSMLSEMCTISDRVKQIKNEATVNENPLEKLIRELREENERLKKVG